VSNLKYWTNQSIVVQSAIGDAQAIDAISKANPGVVTKNSGATLPTNGVWVLLETAGMRQLNNRLFKVSAASGSTFSIGEDTTLFDTFTSGTYRVVTLAHAFDSVRDLASSGGDAVVEDTTSVHDVEDTQDIVSSSPQSFTFTHNWDPTNPALKACNTAFILRSPRGFVITDPDGSAFAFYGTVVAPLQPTVSGKKKVTPVAVSLKATGTSVPAP